MALTAKELIEEILKLPKNDLEKVRKALGSGKGSSGGSGPSSTMDPKELNAYYEAQARVLKIESDLAAQFGDTAEARKLGSQAYEEFLKVQQSAVVQEEDLIRLAKEEGIEYESLGKTALDALTKRAQRQKAGIELSEQEIEALRQQHEEYKKLGPLHEKAHAAGDKHFSSLGKWMGVSTNAYKNSFFGKLSEIAKHAKTPEGLQGLQEAFKKTFNIANISAAIAAKSIGFLFKQIKEIFFGLDEAGASIAAATGHARRYTTEIENMAKANGQFGLGMKENAEGFKAMEMGFAGFYKKGASVKILMAETTAQMKKLGVSTDTTVGLFKTFTAALGKSEVQAANMIKRLKATSDVIGVSVSQMAKDFQKTMPVLSVYGDRAEQVFQGLAAAAAAAQVDVQELLSLAGKFDTFSSAASHVGKLNAIMGTNLNTTSMMMMTEEKRIETLIRTVQQQGEAFGDMPKYKQMAIAHAAGIKDMAKARQIFGMNVGQFRKMSEEQKQAQKSQEELNKAMQAATPVLMKIKMSLTKLIPKIAPIVEWIIATVDATLSWIEANRSWLQYVIPVIAGIAKFTLLIISLKKVAGLLAIPLALMGKALFGVGVTAGKAGMGVMIGMKKVGVGLQGMATGAATALTTLGSGVAGMTKAMGVAVKAAPKAAVVAVILLAVGAAMFLIGAGIMFIGAGFMFAAIGMAKFVDSLTKLVSEAGLGAIPVLFGSLLIAMFAITMIGPFFATSMAMVAMGIGMVALALYALDFEKMRALGDFAKGMENMKKAEIEGSYKAVTTFVDKLDSSSENVKPMLQNLALATTGMSAESGAMGMLGAAIVSLGKTVGETAKEGKEITIKLAGDKVEKLMAGAAIKVMAGTGNIYG